jgi:hypothetical protein
MSRRNGDLATVIVEMCRDMCDLAHVLGRCTTMPSPNDETHKEAIKGALGEVYVQILSLRALVLTLGDVAGFDTTEIMPDRDKMPDDVQEKIKNLTGFMRGESDLTEENEQGVQETVDEIVDEIIPDKTTAEKVKGDVASLLQKLRKRRGDDGDKE